MKRLDAVLVVRALAPTRNKARQLIEAGEVEVEVAGQWKTITQVSYQIDAQIIRLAQGARTLKYVSRGGLKLEGALKQLGMKVTDFKCLDVGVSTGGFADCLLQHGAARVVGVDVGHGQLAEKLKTEAKLKHFEGVHLRDIPAHAALRALLNEGVNLATVDVSFISLTHVFPVLQELLPRGAKLLALVKPQFEVGPANLDKNGIVQDPKLFDGVRSEVLRALGKYGFSSEEYFVCDVKGQDGNQEFFLFATRT